MENEYWPKCGDVLRLDSKGSYGSLQFALVDKHGWQVKLCDRSLSRAIPERYRDEFLMINHYTNLRLLYFTSIALPSGLILHPPAPRGAGAPLFSFSGPCPFTSPSFALFYFTQFPFLIRFTYFLLLVIPSPFYQNSLTPFPGRRS